MKTSGTSSISILRHLPSIDEVMQTEAARRISEGTGNSRLADIVRNAVECVRSEILTADVTGELGRSELLDRVLRIVESSWNYESKKRTQRVINATGVVIHTNLGRAPLSRLAVEALVNEASGYCTVEYDIAAGKRGHRGERAETLLCQLTGAESAVVVNNCAAAAFLVLTVLAASREVVVSRGELVEIGGDFRIPDVLTQSGAVLREVGTTNRTKIADYAAAVNERTAMLLRVHPSNYKITGFTEAADISAMVDLARSKNVVMYEDAGSGALVDMAVYGLPDEPVIADSINAGVDIVSFSGDKLLGGPQSGLIVGRTELIEKLRRSPLYRALRVGKLVYAALEATLQSYLRTAADAEIPVLKMLNTSAESLELRSTTFAEQLAGKCGSIKVDLINGYSVVGGGAGPGYQPPTCLIALSPADNQASSLERRLRTAGKVPVVTRLHEGRVLIDLRTVSVDEESILLSTLLQSTSG